MSAIEFGRFGPVAARAAWLGDPSAVVPTEGWTLAELYEQAGDVTRQLDRPTTTVSTGAYL